MRYKIMYWCNGTYEAEVIDKASNEDQALHLVAEYRLAFKTNNISYQEI